MALIRPIGTVPVRHGRELNRNETPRTGGHRAGAQTETNTQGCCRACRPQLLGPKGSNLSIRASYEEQHSAAAAEGRDSVAGRTASGHRIPLRIDGQGHCACLVCVCVAGRGRQGSRRPASRNQAARARGSGFPGRDRQPASQARSWFRGAGSSRAVHAAAAAVTSLAPAPVRSRTQERSRSGVCVRRTTSLCGLGSCRSPATNPASDGAVRTTDNAASGTCTWENHLRGDRDAGMQSARRRRPPLLHNCSSTAVAIVPMDEAPRRGTRQ